MTAAWLLVGCGAAAVAMQPFPLTRVVDADAAAAVAGRMPVVTRRTFMTATDDAAMAVVKGTERAFNISLAEYDGGLPVILSPPGTPEVARHTDVSSKFVGSDIILVYLSDNAIGTVFDTGTVPTVPGHAIRFPGDTPHSVPPTGNETRVVAQFYVGGTRRSRRSGTTGDVSLETAKTVEATPFRPGQCFEAHDTGCYRVLPQKDAGLEWSAQSEANWMKLSDVVAADDMSVHVTPQELMVIRLSPSRQFVGSLDDCDAFTDDDLVPLEMYYEMGVCKDGYMLEAGVTGFKPGGTNLDCAGVDIDIFAAPGTTEFDGRRGVTEAEGGCWHKTTKAGERREGEAAEHESCQPQCILTEHVDEDCKGTQLKVTRGARLVPCGADEGSAKDSSGLSTGAIVGIACGAVVVVGIGIYIAWVTSGRPPALELFQ